MSNECADRPTALAALHQAIRACRACQDAGYLPEARPIRDGGRVGDRVMLIGQAPGTRSDLARQHFVGPGGKLLESWFERAGFPPGYLRERVYLTSLTRCFPGKSASGKGDRAPSPPELALCQPFLERELALVRPALVLLVGGMAITAFLGRAPLQAMVGTRVERDGRLWLPLPHPSPVSRWLNQPANREQVARAIALLAESRARLELA
jgi:uracil-DNA glycosylase family 4